MRGRRAAPAVVDPIRRPVAVVVISCLFGLLALAVRYAGTDKPGVFDARADAIIYAAFAPHRGALLRWLVPLGNPRSVAAAAVLLALMSLGAGRRRLSFVAVVGPGATGVATAALQPAIGRTFEGGFALPSGHTAGATALATVAALLVVSLARSRLRTVGLAAAAGVLCFGAIMGVALVANGLHYSTDTLAGFCTAVAIVLGLALAFDWAMKGNDPP